ncbi:MAG: hypothetical protein K9G65_04605 [Rickettsiaceae bacterium]|nr:hypothetical protein [Rickettsiaceae bacterium]
MSKNNSNITSEWFETHFVSFIKRSIESAGGLEKYLEQNPHIASRIQGTSQNPDTISWLTNNSPFNPTEITNSFNKLTLMHEKQQLSGETVPENDSSDS